MAILSVRSRLASLSIGLTRCTTAVRRRQYGCRDKGAEEDSATCLPPRKSLILHACSYAFCQNRVYEAAMASSLATTCPTTLLGVDAPAVNPNTTGPDVGSQAEVTTSLTAAVDGAPIGR